MALGVCNCQYITLHHGLRSVSGLIEGDDVSELVTAVSIETLLGKLRDGEWLVPQFQRDFVWSIRRGGVIDRVDLRRASDRNVDVVGNSQIAPGLPWNMYRSRIRVTEGEPRRISVTMTSAQIGNTRSSTAGSDARR